MLRLVVVALVAANLLFFAWASGVFAPSMPPPRAGESEPERLAAQVRPEVITVLPAKAAAAVLSAARAAAAQCAPSRPTRLDAEILAARQKPSTPGTASRGHTPA